MIKHAKGHVQARMVRDLESTGTTDNFCCYMKAKKCSGKYTKSFLALASRLLAAGYNVSVVKGSRGGYWNAFMILDK